MPRIVPLFLLIVALALVLPSTASAGCNANASCGCSAQIECPAPYQPYQLICFWQTPTVSCSGQSTCSSGYRTVSCDGLTFTCGGDCSQGSDYVACGPGATYTCADCQSGVINCML